MKKNVNCLNNFYIDYFFGFILNNAILFFIFIFGLTVQHVAKKNKNEN